MGEYIDRNKIFPNKTFFASAENPLKSLDELIKRIWSIPAADVVEVVHGHWISQQEAETINDYGKAYCCSICGHCDWDCTESESFNYCPHCGAKMDGGKDNG